MRCESGYPYAQVWVPPNRSFVAARADDIAHEQPDRWRVPARGAGDEHSARFTVTIGAARSSRR